MKKNKKNYTTTENIRRFILLFLKFICYLQTVLCVAPELPAAFYVLLEKN